ELVDMADSFRASAMQKVRDIYIPYLIPPLLATSRIGFSLAWKIVVLSEVFGFSTGIGYLIKLKYLHYDLRMLMAWLMIFLGVVVIIEQFLRILEKRVTRWR
ncbi:MAG: ABC transporter permease subunit, partial [Candidatus Aerophobus sp.]